MAASKGDAVRTMVKKGGGVGAGWLLVGACGVIHVRGEMSGLMWCIANGIHWEIGDAH